jgi:ABC-type glucose/galactose transport system permease subunit
MPEVPKGQSGTSGYSWKLSAAAAVASVIGAVATFGEVSPIITGLILLTAVGWGFTARDNKRVAEEEQNPENKNL